MPISVKNPLSSGLMSQRGEVLVTRGQHVRVARDRSGSGQNGDLPPGTSCAASDCAEGSTLDSAICCKEHHYRHANIPPFGLVYFEYVSGEVWETAEFTRSCYGADGTYKFRRTLSLNADGNVVSTIELVTVSIGDCDPPWCLVYETCCRVGCLCVQRHALVHFGGLSSSDIAGEICLHYGPEPAANEECAGCTGVPATVYISVSGFTDADGCNCDAMNGEFTLPFNSGDGTSCGWQYSVDRGDSLGISCCPFVGGGVTPWTWSVVVSKSGSDWIVTATPPDGCGSWSANVGTSCPDWETAITLGVDDTSCAPSSCPPPNDGDLCTVGNVTVRFGPSAATEDGACDSPCIGYGGGGSDTCAGSITYIGFGTFLGVEWVYQSGSCTGTCGAGTCSAPAPSTPPTYEGQEVSVPCSCA